MRVTHTSGDQCYHFCCFCCPMSDRPEHTPLASGPYRRIRALQRAASPWPLPADQSTAARSEPLAPTGGSEHCSAQRASGLYRWIRALQRAASLWPLPADQSTAARSEPLAPTGGSEHCSAQRASWFNKGLQGGLRCPLLTSCLWQFYDFFN